MSFWFLASSVYRGFRGVLRCEQARLALALMYRSEYIIIINIKIHRSFRPLSLYDLWAVRLFNHWCS